ncbi:hypothetical protein E3U43_010589 [Larimichthys crocea]|uniref:Uncharacterized protein n=1 Tax=Larimichthys crocea TaxID=215358 RepID=A0ACD3RI07_LARCR|nr:hypothetical protein E3U43_010589 [Larimichthys crocea]
MRWRRESWSCILWRGPNLMKKEDDGGESMSASPWKSVPSTNETPRKKNSSDSLRALKEAVVVLTRLPEYKISALRPPTPEQFYSEDESLSSSDSDMESEPEVSEPAAVIISSAFAHCSEEITKVRPDLPDEDVKVDMMVLARRKTHEMAAGKNGGNNNKRRWTVEVQSKF